MKNSGKVGSQSLQKVRIQLRLSVETQTNSAQNPLYVFAIKMFIAIENSVNHLESMSLDYSMESFFISKFV